MYLSYLSLQDYFHFPSKCILHYIKNLKMDRVFSFMLYLRGSVMMLINKITLENLFMYLFMNAFFDSTYKSFNLTRLSLQHEYFVHMLIHFFIMIENYSLTIIFWAIISTILNRGSSTTCLTDKRINNKII